MRSGARWTVVAIVLSGASAAGAQTGAGEVRVAPASPQMTWFPIVYYTPETSVAAGGGAVLTWRKEGQDGSLRPDSLQAFLVYTAKQQSFLRLNPEVYLRDGRFRVEGALTHIHMPTSYFGIGNPSDLDRDEVDAREEKYTNRRFALEGAALVSVAGPLRVGVVARFARDRLRDLEAGGELAGGGVPGSAGGEVGGVGPVVEWDTRDRTFAPATGSWLRAWVQSHRRALGSDFRFERYGLDLRHYLPVGSGHVLALQAGADTVRGQVPFYQLVSPPLRGLYQGVFVDRAQTFVQGEWRMRPRGRWGAAVFAGAGGTGADLSDIRPAELWAAGAGVRYLLNAREGIALRLDLGVSPLGVFPYFMIMEAF